MSYKIMCRNKDGSTEELEGNIKESRDAQTILRSWQTKVKPRFCYIKKEGWFG
jgi:hypothetical protein